MCLCGDGGKDGAGFVLGDKRTELVLIGQMDKAKVRACLEACLLTNEEIARLGPPTSKKDGWCGLDDPFELPGIWSAEGGEGGACPMPERPQQAGTKRAAADEANEEQGKQAKKARTDE